MGISFHRGPVWGNWRRAHLPGSLKDGKGGSVDEASLSLKRLREGGLGEGAPSLRTLEDMLQGCSDGAPLCKDSIGGPGGGAPLLGTQKMRFLRDTQNAL